MGATEKKSRRRGRRARPGSVVDDLGDGVVLVGTTEPDDVSAAPVVALVEARHRRKVQDRTLLGLLFLLGEVLVLGVLAMAGVALGWFEPAFAIEVLAITVSPSFTAWLLVVRWAFRSGGRRT